jgi:hypothetical protein
LILDPTRIVPAVARESEELLQVLCVPEVAKTELEKLGLKKWWGKRRVRHTDHHAPPSFCSSSETSRSLAPPEKLWRIEVKKSPPQNFWGTIALFFEVSETPQITHSLTRQPRCWN